MECNHVAYLQLFCNPSAILYKKNKKAITKRIEKNRYKKNEINIEFIIKNTQIVVFFVKKIR